MADPVSTALVTTLVAVYDGLVGELVRRTLKAARRERRQEAYDRPDQVIELVKQQFGEFRRRELTGMPEEEWEAAVQAVGDSLDTAVPVDHRATVLVLLDAERLERHVRGRSEQVRRASLLSGAGQAAYDRLLSACCAAIVQYAQRIPELERLFRRETIERLTAIEGDLDGVFGLLLALLDPDDQDFGDRYAGQVKRALGEFELFGASLDNPRRRYSFDRSYVTLSVARADRRDGDRNADLSGAGIPVTHAFSETRRVLLRGGAGSGKTTFLRWLAMRAIDGQPWPEAAPLFVPLRTFADRPFPRPGQLVDTVAEVLPDTMKERWVTTRLEDGRALLLVDGVDELFGERRQELRDWLEAMVTAYPRARWVVTTRPSAVPEDWLAGCGFVAYDLLPMSSDGVHRYITHWHDAVRGDNPGDDDLADWLNECRQRLITTLDARPDLRSLAASPLLCGLLCALHKERRMQLPQDRRGFYNEALKLLLDWDERRGLPVPFKREERMVLLQRFAYSLVRNGEILISKDDAVGRFRHAMRGLRPHVEDPETTLQSTLERTGLLREPYPEQIQFVHRTFRDYLAAKELVEAGDIGLLLEHAQQDEWSEIVVMAVMQGRPAERGRVLGGLLAGTPATRRDPAALDRLHLLAGASLAQVDVVEPAEVRDQVRRAIARLIPPARPDAAEMLARAGGFVLDLLPGPEAELTESQAAGVVRAAAMIGGPAAVLKIREFATGHHSMVIEELLRAWRQVADPEDYAKTVLADVDFGDRLVPLSNWRRMRYVKHLRRLHAVRCLGDVDALAELAATPQLRHLELMQNDAVRDLSPLAACRTLRSLHLNLCRALCDLSPLADTAINELALHFTPDEPADLATLRCPSLRRLIFRYRDLDDGLEPLPGDLPLRELVLDNRPPRPNLAGIQRWQTLETISMIGIPAAPQVELLTRLPLLRHLYLDIRTPGAEMAELERGLPNVQVHVGKRVHY